MTPSVITSFVETAMRFPQRTAVRVNGQDLRYGELHRLASAVAAALSSAPDGPLVALLANRTVSAFAGVTGILLAGRAYVPVNPAFPPGRIRQTLAQTGCRIVIAEPDALPSLAVALDAASPQLTIVIPEEGADPAIVRSLARHTVIPAGGIVSPGAAPAPAVTADELAYVMFTSGSTGIPKGVMTTHGNIRSVIETLQERYHISRDDRLSLNAEMTFSASVLVIFLAWAGGATICCPSKRDLLTPARFIVDEGITIWKCVPSLVALMERTRQLHAGAFPTVRVTTFGGEQVPADIVRAWSVAAPNSVIENVYGSTESTVNAFFHRWNREVPEGSREHGAVPIGRPLPGITALVCDEHLAEVGPGETGELLLHGPLMTPGYWNDPERTAAAYIVPPGKNERFYRTGDIVRRPRGHDPFVFVGRRDNQIKVLGNRVELGDIEATARVCLGLTDVVALGWPPSPRGFDGIELFVAATDRPDHEIFRMLKQHLAPYMLPRRIRILDRLPLNASGKVDRIALRTILEREVS